MQQLEMTIVDYETIFIIHIYHNLHAKEEEERKHVFLIFFFLCLEVYKALRFLLPTIFLSRMI